MEGASWTALLSPDTKTIPLHRKCFLGPGSVIFAEVDVNSNFMTNYRLQQFVMHWLEEAVLRLYNLMATEAEEEKDIT